MYWERRHLVVKERYYKKCKWLIQQMFLYSSFLVHVCFAGLVADNFKVTRISCAVACFPWFEQLYGEVETIMGRTCGLTVKWGVKSVRPHFQFRFLLLLYCSYDETQRKLNENLASISWIPCLIPARMTRNVRKTSIYACNTGSKDCNGTKRTSMPEWRSPLKRLSDHWCLQCHSIATNCYIPVFSLECKVGKFHQ